MEPSAQATKTLLDQGIFQLIRKRLPDRIETPFEIRLGGDHIYRFGAGEPAFKVTVKDRNGLAALSRFDELKICEAYMDGSLDFTGDMLQAASFRAVLRDRLSLAALWERVAPWVIGRVRSDRQAIAAHYDLGNEFYLTFMDRSRCYSQAVFEHDGETLETAQRRKLDFAVDACKLKPGSRVLDVGGGWGSFTEHAGRRDISVTSLTISQNSEEFIWNLIRRQQLPCQVVNKNFLEYEAAEPYDAIVILGVMEHLPDYPRVLRQLLRLLKPGGYVYLDASAFRMKYDKPSFVARYIFPGDHSYFCLHEFLATAAGTELETLAVYNDRHSYFLTCKAWAENLEAARDRIIRRWGEMIYRRFRLYLWGSAYAFASRGMDAYRVVLQRPARG